MEEWASYLIGRTPDWARRALIMKDGFPEDYHALVRDLSELCDSYDERHPDNDDDSGEHEMYLLQLGSFYEAYLNRKKTGEREAYIRALMALSGLVKHVASRCEKTAQPRTPRYYYEECFDWFEVLISMLEDLDRGIVSATLDCQLRGKNLPTNVWVQRVTMVLAVEGQRLLGMKSRAAAQKVVDAIPHKGTSGEDILSWCAEFRKGRVKNEIARRIYERDMQSYRELDPSAVESSVEYYLTCLRVSPHSNPK
jgi:hypothetical protein